MSTYKGRNVKTARPAEFSDYGFDGSKSQSWITFDDGSSIIGLTSDIQNDNAKLYEAAPPSRPRLSVPVMGTYKGKNVMSMRSVAIGDTGYDHEKNQTFVTFDDSTSATVPTSDVIIAPYNPANPIHTPIRAGRSSDIDTIDGIIAQLVDMRNRMRGVASPQVREYPADREAQVPELEYTRSPSE